MSMSNQRPSEREHRRALREPRLQVILVEDDDALRSSLGDWLEARGWEVRAVANGVEFAETIAEVLLMRDDRAPPDAIITADASGDIIGWNDAAAAMFRGDQ